MIEWEKFKKAMIYIGKRTASVPDAETLTMYYEYLSPQLTTEEFLTAARNVWKSAIFFPPPITFLSTRCGPEWLLVMQLLSEFTPPHTPADWHDRWMALSETARAAVQALGGPLTFKEQVMDRNVAKAKTLFTEGYTEALEAVDDAGRLERALTQNQLAASSQLPSTPKE